MQQKRAGQALKFAGLASDRNALARRTTTWAHLLG